MKKIARTIAMILVLVMLASSFTSCFTIWAITGEPPSLGGDLGYGAIALILVLPADLAVAGVVLIVKAGIKAARNKRGQKMEGIDTFSALIKSLPEAELDSLMLTLDSLPEAELASLTLALNTLPEAEIESFTETILSFSKVEFSAMVVAFNNLSEEEIIASMGTMNSMPEESFIALLHNVQPVEPGYIH
jgi:hypothetical protein